MNYSASLKLKIVYIDFGRLCYNLKKCKTPLYNIYKNVFDVIKYIAYRYIANGHKIIN